MNGLTRVITIKIIIVINIPLRSLIEKNGWNDILSRLEFVPRGLLDPV
jgi:hypothetical protein